MVKSRHNIKALKIENDAIINNIITKYLNELKKRNINVISAYLFGSYAKGNATEWSDIDLAIIVNKFIGDEFDFQALLNKIIVEIKLYDIEAHPFLEEEFDRTNPFVLEILKTVKKVSDLFILLLPTAFDVVGSFCFQACLNCKIYLLKTCCILNPTY